MIWHDVYTDTLKLCNVCLFLRLLSFSLSLTHLSLTQALDTHTVQTCIITAWSCLWIAGFQGKGCLDYGNLSQNIFICIHFTSICPSSFGLHPDAYCVASRRSGQELELFRWRTVAMGDFFACRPEAVNTSRASVVYLLWRRPQQLKPRDTEKRLW